MASLRKVHRGPRRQHAPTHEGGAFEAFADLANGKDMKPVPLVPNQRQFSDFKVHFTSVRMETASRLGLASTVTPLGGALYGTRWGAGFRVMITLWDLQAKWRHLQLVGGGFEQDGPDKEARRRAEAWLNLAS